MARQLIDVVARNGVDAVKFQTHAGAVRAARSTQLYARLLGIYLI
jgi:sialic acid synthase SpsE